MGAITDQLLKMDVGQLEIVEEEDFAVDPGGGAYLETLGQIDVTNLIRMRQPHQALRQSVDDPHPDLFAPDGVVGPNATFQTKHYLAGYRATAPANVAEIAAGLNYPLALCLKALLGGQVAGQLDQTVADSTVAIIKGTDATNWNPGHALLVETPSGYEVAWVKDIGGAPGPDYTLRAKLAAAPVSGKTMFGGVNTWAANSLVTSCTIRWTGWMEGAETPLRVVCLGCVPESGEIQWDPQTQPTLSLTWRVAAALRQDDYNAGSVYQPWAYPRPEYLVAGGAALYQADGTKLNDLEAPTISISVMNDLKTYLSPTATYGIFTHKLGARRIVAKVRTDYLEENFGDESQLKLVHGSGPGHMVAIGMPRVYVENLSGPLDDQGYALADRELRALRYAGDTGSSAPANHLFNIALL